MKTLPAVTVIDLSWYAPIALGILLAIFLLDLNLPFAGAIAAAYAVPVVAGLWVRGRRFVVAVASVGSVLAVLGLALKRGQPVSLVVILNLATALLLISMSAVAVLRYKRLAVAAEFEVARRHSILDTAVDGLIAIDERGHVSMFNRAAERIFGYSVEEILGRNISMLMPAPYHEEHDVYLSRYMHEGKPRIIGIGREVVGRRKSGELFPVDLSVSEVRLDGKRLFTGLVRDITQRKAAEREREFLIGRLQEKNAELERFTYTVSHDLKSPLVTIKGFLGMLEKSALSGDTVRLGSDIARIGAAADRMKNLLDDLLELSRIGRAANPPKDVSLDEIAREVRESLAGAISESQAGIEIAADLPVVRGDRVRLVEVLQNLVENAIKFAGTGRAPRVEIGARQDGAELVLFVRDDGVGIEPRFAEKVFGLFEKLRRDTPGTGVGLALVKRIVEVHGGRVWVESEGEGRGSCFCFTLPGPPAEEVQGVSA